ncbi:MAG: ABC transporter ATP-binding protein [Bacteroidales bacterium]|nr:ABC transporter ATP-binding protein [Bacteroidales bacterium]
MIQISGLTLSYGPKVLARDISFHIAPGECLLLAGRNGCGKSTLLRYLASDIYSEIASASLRPLPSRHASPGKQACPPSASAVGPSLLQGRGWPWISEHISDAKFVLMPTNIPKVKGFTLEEFVRTGCFRESNWAGRLNAQTEKRLQEALKVLGLQAQAGQDISTLSDGEFQKACIAVGLTRHADVLLLDEPTAFLDVENRLMVLETLRRVADDTGMAVLFSSHDLHDSLRVASRVLAFTPDSTFLESAPDNMPQTLQAAFPSLTI